MNNQFLSALKTRLKQVKQQKQLITHQTGNKLKLNIVKDHKIDLPLDQIGRIKMKSQGISAQDFNVIRTLGLGSYGRVLLVRYRDDQRQLFAMKKLKKKTIVDKNQTQQVKFEKQLLAQCKCPFVLSLKAFFQDQAHVYFLTQFAAGGDLFMRLRSQGRFSNDVALFYMTQILVGLNYMHDKQIVYRDLKPQNLLIQKYGHLILGDLGFAKYLPQDRTTTVCGTPQYLAPELIKIYRGGARGAYGKSVDWWALGILLYQMLVGYPPFLGKDPFDIYDRVQQGIVQFPRFMTVKAKDLIKRLLNPVPQLRLGQNDCGVSIMRHKWFKGVNWKKVNNKDVPSPWMPRLKQDDDTYCFQKFQQEVEEVNNQYSATYEQFQDF